MTPADEHSPVSVAAAELAGLRTRARAIAVNRFLTTSARVAMLRENDAAVRGALHRWRELAGIAPLCTGKTSTSRVGRYRAW
jgi:hypothetical protein